MKKLLVSLLCAVIAVSSFAQDNDLMFFVYQNNGALTRYYMDEVDSITYSKIDLNDVEQEDYITQVVWTFSGPERFDLSQIDSVAFRTPGAIYQPNVIRVDDATWADYVLRVEDLTIVFSNDIPQELIPEIGQVLFAEFNDLFKDGFAGVVETVEVKDDEIIVTCYAADFDDVFEELTLVGDYYIVEDETTDPAGAPKYRLLQAPRESRKALGLDYNKEFPYTFEKELNFSKENIGLKGHIKQGIKIGVVARLVLGEEPYVELRFADSEDYELAFSASYSLEYSWEKKLEGEKILDLSAVIPNCPVLKINYMVHPFVQPGFKANADLHVAFKSAGEYAFMLNREGFDKQIKDRNSELQLSANLSFHGWAYMGLTATVGLSTTGDFLSANAGVHVGPKFNADLNVDFTQDDLHRTATGPYNSMLSSNAGLSVDLEATFNVGYDLKIKKGKKSFDYPLTAWEIGRFYLVPEFTQPELSVQGNNVVITSNISRNLLLPARVGYRIFDEDENLIETVYDQNNYWLNKNFTNQPLKLTVNGLANKAYSAYPVFAMATLAPVLASPNTDFDVNLNVTTLEPDCGSSSTKVIVNGKVEGLQEANDVIAGVIYTDTNDANMLIVAGGATYSTVNKNLTKDGDFSVVLKNLTASTEYQYRAFVKIGESVTYGETYKFKTKDESSVQDAVADLLCLKNYSENVVFFLKPDSWNNLYLNVGEAGTEGTNIVATEVGDGYFRAVIPDEINLKNDCLRMYWHNGSKINEGGKQTQPVEVKTQRLYYITHEARWKEDNSYFVPVCEVKRVNMVCDLCD